MSGSCKLLKESLSQEIQHQLNSEGVCIVPIPEELAKIEVDGKACQQYALPEYKENLILLDTGHAKLMSPFFSLELLHQIPGMENARYEDPYAGGLGNSIRYFDMTPHDELFKVNGLNNLYCCGEKAGPLVGHTEAIITGTFAGVNAIGGKALLPESLAIGFAMNYFQQALTAPKGLNKKYTFSGSVLFDELAERGLYTADTDAIHERVRLAGLEGALSH
jgi:hypothetical protein